jgi:hypothetical protein
VRAPVLAQRDHGRIRVGFDESLESLVQRCPPAAPDPILGATNRGRRPVWASSVHRWL